MTKTVYIEIHQECKDCHRDLLACDKERYSGASIPLRLLGTSSPLTEGEAPQRRRGEKRGRVSPSPTD